MQIGDIIKKNYSNSYSNNNKKTIAIAIGDKQVDSLLEEHKDIYHPNYRAWHAKIIKNHGSDFWLKLVKTARLEGRNPERYLVWLINRSL